MENVKEFLREYAKLEEELEDEKERLQRLIARTEGGSPQINGMPAAGHKTSDKFGTYAAQKEECELRIRSLEKRTQQRRYEIEMCIEDLTPFQKDIIRLKYIELIHSSWLDIVKMKFGKRKDFATCREKYENKVYQAHGKALAKIKELLCEKNA